MLIGLFRVKLTLLRFYQWKRISGGRPFVIKGIQCAADALKALEVGAVDEEDDAVDLWEVVTPQATR